MVNSVARARTLISVALAAAKLLEMGEPEERVEALEAAARSRPSPTAESVFDQDPHDPAIVFRPRTAVNAASQRLLRVETALTPKQAFLLWLQEAHAFHSVTAYVQTLGGKPGTAYPLIHLPTQVDQATRLAMKGHSRSGSAAGWQSPTRIVVSATLGAVA